MSRTLHATRSLCPLCDRVLDAALVARDGDVYIESTCGRHGAFSTLYFRDATLYEALRAEQSHVVCCTTYDCAAGAPCSRRAANTMIYMVNVTNNCNMTCDACLSGSEIGKHEVYLPAEHIARSLPAQPLGPRRPHAVLFGGEPTLHPELARIVRHAAESGYVPRLASNGLKLKDAAYVRTLADAGLGWVVLHFDSLDETRNERLRGRPMLAASKRALATCRDAGIKTQLAVTVARENLDEVGDILRFARDHGVFWVSLYPAAEIERPGSDGPIYLADVLAALERGTRGQITSADFLASARALSRLYRLTGRANFRQKPTMVSLPTVIDGPRFVPFNRFFSARGAARRPLALARLARSLPALLDYERRAPTGDTLVVNVQQFQGRRAFDLEEATHNHMSYASEGSFLPFDVFNHVHRYREQRLQPASTLLRTPAS